MRSPAYTSRARPRASGGLMARRPQPAAAPPPADARTTEEQLAELDREIEYYRRRAELERLKKEAKGEPTA